MVIRDIKGGIGPTSTRNLEYLVHEQTDISFFRIVVLYPDATDQRVVFVIYEIDQFDFNSQSLGAEMDIADQRRIFKIDAYLPSTVVHPRKFTIYPDTNLMLRATCVRQIIQTNVWFSYG